MFFPPFFSLQIALKELSALNKEVNGMKYSAQAASILGKFGTYQPPSSEDRAYAGNGAAAFSLSRYYAKITQLVVYLTHSILVMGK